MQTYTRYTLLLALVLFSAFRAAAQLAMPDSVCVGATKHYWVDSTSTSGSTFTWKIDGSVRQTGPVNLLSVTWNNTGLFPLSVQELSAEGCYGPLRSGQVLVSPLPTALLGGGSTICEGDTARLHVVFTGTPPWSITYTNGATAATIGNIASNPYIFSVTPPAGINTYSLLSSSDVFCASAPAQTGGSAIVLVHPAPVADFSATSACHGDTTFFLATGDNLYGIKHWVWDFGDGSFGTFNTPSNTSHIYDAYGTYTVKLTVSDSIGCSYLVSHTVEVRPSPTAFFSNSGPVCNGSPMAFSDLSSNPSGQGYLQQWEWDFNDGSPHQLVTFPASPNVAHTYAAAGVYDVVLKTTSSLGCSATFTNTVTVINHPLAGFTFTTNCINETTLFADASQAQGITAVNSWKWDFGDPLSGTSNTSALKDPQHIYHSAGDYTVLLIVENAAGCSDTVAGQLTVRPSPVAAFTLSPGCVNAPAYFETDSTLTDIHAIATYQWQFGDGGTGNGRSIQHTYLASGSYNVTLTVLDTSGCSGSQSHIVVITVPPLAHFAANTTNCAGQSVQLNDLSTSVAGYNTSWLWNFGDGNTQQLLFPASPDISHTYQQNGTYEVTLSITNSEGCTSSESNTISVAGSPQASFVSSGHCEGNAVAFTDLSPITAAFSINAWAWDFGDAASGTANGSTSQNASHIYSAAGNYTVQLIIWSSNGCSDTLTKEILIKARPDVAFTAQGSCEGTPIAFVPGTVINTNTIATWFWEFGDGSNSTAVTPVHSYTAPGTYTASLTLSDTAGCSNSVSKLITLVPAPLVSFAFTTPACNQSTVTFTDQTTVPAGFITKRSWDFGDGTYQSFAFPNAGIVEHTYTGAGNFNVTLTVKTSDSCSSFISRLMVISPKPVAEFSHQGSCQDASIAFTDLTGTNGAGVSERLWDFGDPGSGTSNQSTQSNPSHIYALSGTYTVRLIASTASGCSDTTSQTLTVAPLPLIDFSSVAGCNMDTTHFNSSASVAMGSTASWFWQFGDGLTSTLPDPAHMYSQSGSYVVALTITDTSGCQSTKSSTVIVTPGPLAAFAGASPSCEGTAVWLTDLSTFASGSIALWHWTFGDGSDTTYSAAATAISHMYAQPGNFMITLTVNSPNGCENSVQQTISIAASPVAGFAWLNTCEGSPTQFSDQSMASQGVTITGRYWDFGDPGSGVNNASSFSNPAHIFISAGTYPVSLTVTNAAGCTDTILQQIIITAKPGVGFYHDTVTCIGTPLAFYTDTTATAIASVQSYNWNFGDGTSNVTQQNPVHSYANPGTYTVILSIVNQSGCSNSASHEVTIGESPVSLFSYANACQATPTQFTDLSYAPDNGAIVKWSWDFGVNGSTTDTSTLQNPLFAYALPGTYTVMLKSTSESGCSNSQTLPVQIFNKPTAGFNFSAEPCGNGLVQFRDSSYSYQSGIASWHWEFEPFQYSTAQNPTHQYYAKDSCYNVKLMIADLRGCADTVTRQVCVPAQLAVSFDYQNDCFGSPTKFAPLLLSPLADSLIGFAWNFGDPQSGATNISSLKKPSHTFTKAGSYTVNLTATDKSGCPATIFRTVEIKALPQASFTYSEGQCDSIVTFAATTTDTSGLTNKYIWDFGDGTSDTLMAPVNIASHKFLTQGLFSVKLTVVTENGCTDQESQLFELKPCLIAAFAKTSQTECQDYTISFADLSKCQGQITLWEWNWGDTTQAFAYNTMKPSVTHSYSHPGKYTITLKVTTLLISLPYTDSTFRNVIIIASPRAGFTSSPACAGSRVNFHNTTLSDGSAIERYEWDFGDQAAANDTSAKHDTYYTYPEAGDFTTRLVATNSLGCSDTATGLINVNGLPVAGFNYSVACLAHPVRFADHSDPYLAPLLFSGWVIRDSEHVLGHRIGPNMMFTFDSMGVYTVQHAVSDTNGCTDSIAYQITVVPSPLSAFSVVENYEDKQGQVHLENGSLGADEYFWDFGNGQTSDEASPVATFTEDGNYLIQLYSRNNYECTDSIAVEYKLLFKGLWIPNALATGAASPVRLWKPVGVNLSQYSAAIYNRKGEMIWSSSVLTDKGAPAEGWDGTFKDVLCPEGVYAWRITAIYSDGSIWRNDAVGNRDGLSGGNTGTVTLIR